jgi:Ca2+-binding RTX toxin-like protein
MLVTQGTQAHTGGEGLIVRSNTVGVDAESGCVLIQQSTFGGASGQGNGTALYMSASSVANFVVQLSNISWNTVGAQNNSTTLSISAILDWWGNAAGPGPVDGLGRNPVGGLVDYIPFATGSNVTTFASGVLVIGGNIYVVGTNNADNITVTIGSGTTTPQVKVQFGTTTLGTYTLGSDLTQNRVVIYGLDGNDTIRVVGTRNAEIHGGDGNDTITGGSGTDVIYGEGGDDTIDGGAGNDVLVGGVGRDTLIGNAGDNIMMAGDLACFMVFNGPGGPRRYDFTTMQQIVAGWSAMGGGNPSGNASTAELQSDALAGFIGDTSGDSMSNGTGKGWFICQATDTVTTSTAAPNWRTNTP